MQSTRILVLVSSLFSVALASSMPAQEKALEQKPSTVLPDEKGQPATTDDHTPATLGREIKGRALLDDLEEFRTLLKQEWILSNLNDADFDAAIDSIVRDAPAGMTIAELSSRLQRVLALGGDGHAHIGQFSGALAATEGVRPDFVIDLDGDGYTAYRVKATDGPIDAKRKYKFSPLKEGYPHLVAIDGVPISDWVKAAEPYVYKGPELAVRWRSMRILQESPFLRRELQLPEAPVIRVRLASTDRTSEIELDAPTNPYQRWHLKVPRPGWRILQGNVGYLWIHDPASGGVEAIIDAMPRLRDTRGLIIDLRDNTGGAGLDALQVMAAYLLPADRPRCAIGEIVHWQGERWATNTGEVSVDTEGLSEEGRRLVAAFEAGFEREWQPPNGRATEARVVFLARPEAEPELLPYDHELFQKTYAYTAPVVVLYNHRCFSAAEIFLAGIREVSDVTLVGSPTTAAGGGSPQFFRLRHSGLNVVLSKSVFVRADGTLIDGRGVVPDVVVESDASDYVGPQDRMLEKAIEALEGKLDGKANAESSVSGDN